MPDPTPQDRAAWRKSLRETAFPSLPNFGAVPERIEVTYCIEFCGAACTCRLAGSHVIYCRGCGKAWLELPETRPLADPPVDQPSFCACTCRDGDPHYEDWVTDPWVCTCGMIAPKGEFRVFPHDDCDGGRVLTLGRTTGEGGPWLTSPPTW